MRVRYTPNAKLYDEYYNNQSGFGLPVYVGGMRGKGIGSVLSGLFRAAVPLLKKGGKALLKEGLTSGMQVANDVLAGQNIKTAVKKRVQGGSRRLLKRAIGQFNAPPGEPAVKRIRRRKVIKKSKGRRDIFG